MPKLEWDKIQERVYETGLDRGVLYLPSAPRDYDHGVVWNGLTSVDEDFSTDVTRPHYFDGVKYLDSAQSGDFAAKLNAYTYPDEFLEFEGIGSLGNGLFADDQNQKVFGLSYRTRVGNAVDGVDHGYKIHLLYNLTAIEDTVNYQNGSNLSEPLTFKWIIRGVPETINNYRPTAHAIVDSRFLPRDLLKTIEDIIYGTDDYEEILDGGTPQTSGLDLVDGGTVSSAGLGLIDGNIRTFIGGAPPRLPSLSDFIGLVIAYGPRLIIPDLIAGMAELVAEIGDLTQTAIDGVYSALPDTRLVKAEPDGLNYLL
jgi:hypothetical protein